MWIYVEMSTSCYHHNEQLTLTSSKGRITLQIRTKKWILDLEQTTVSTDFKLIFKQKSWHDQRGWITLWKSDFMRASLCFNTYQNMICMYMIDSNIR